MADATPDGSSSHPARAERLLAAVRTRPRLVARLLRRRPELAAANVFTAGAAGDGDRLASLLAVDRSAATRSHEGDGWPPLLYVAASPLHRESAGRAAGLRRCAELLLAHGADANSHTTFQGEQGPGPLPALYFACAGDNAGVVETLLAHGADPNDGESIYHAAEHDHELGAPPESLCRPRIGALLRARGFVPAGR